MAPASFRERMYGGIEAYARMKPNAHLCELWTQLETRLDYIDVPPDDTAAFEQLAQRIEQIESTSATEGNILFST